MYSMCQPSKQYSYKTHLKRKSCLLPHSNVQATLNKLEKGSLQSQYTRVCWHRKGEQNSHPCQVRTRAQPRRGWAALAAGDPRHQNLPPCPGPSLPMAALYVGAPALEKPHQRFGVGTLPRGPLPHDESDPQSKRRQDCVSAGYSGRPSCQLGVSVLCCGNAYLYTQQN